MNSQYIETLKRHISTHTVRSAEDRSAVSYLESVLNPEGRINTSFASDDKWPNHDGCLNMFQIRTNLDVQNKILLYKSRGHMIILKVMELFHTV